MVTQEWPMDKITFEPAPFLTADFISGSIFGGVLEPFAVSRKGVGIYKHDLVPLHVGMDKEKEKFCIRADKRNYNRKYDKNDTIKLAYTIRSETISEKYIACCIISSLKNLVWCQINK